MAIVFSNCKDKPEQTTSTQEKKEMTFEKVDSTEARPDTFYVYSNSNDGNVNIRKEPSAKAEAIGILYTNGNGVRLIDDSGSWWKVETDDGVGFVNSKYVIKRHPQAGEETAITTKPIIEVITDKDSLDKEEEEVKKQNIESASESKTKQDKTAQSKSSTSEQTSKPSQAQSTSQQASKSNNKKVYYVVVSSWQDFEKAKTSYGKIPDALEGPIYKVKSNGKTIYRMCSSCHSTKEKAQAEVNKIKKYTNSDIWIWESDGLGECVYTSVDAKGDKMRPLSPR